MEIIGIICEYNPFHNGHILHLQKIKQLYPDSLIILVLGGNFLERGDISLISKWNKTKIALQYGIDIVIELPTLFNTNSADIFAYHSVSYLNYMGVTKIIFGSECNDVTLLKKLACSQSDLHFNEEVRKNLKSGNNYPTSLSIALKENIESNDILGIAYIKAINKINPHIEPVCIKRTNSFNNTKSNGKIISAQNIREKISKNIDIKKFIPSYDINCINRIDHNKLFELLKYKIMTENHLERFLGVDEGLENRIRKVINTVATYEELIDNLKTKRYTKSRIKRMLLHILLGIEKSDINEIRHVPRVIGFNQNGQNYLKKQKLIKKYNDTPSIIEKRATLIYFILTNDESNKLEYLNKPIIKY